MTIFKTKNTRVIATFKNTLALFTIIKEYYVNNEIDFAKILFEIKGKKI